MFVLSFTAANPGVPKVYAVPYDVTVDVLSVIDKYGILAPNDSTWIPPCCWADHE